MSDMWDDDGQYEDEERPVTCYVCVGPGIYGGRTMVKGGCFKMSKARTTHVWRTFRNRRQSV
jgi:hypothetical protein